VFARDLTARKQAEAQRMALETQLRESQKMQAVGTMAGGIAHDFNNILSAILGNVELAKQDTRRISPPLTSLVEIEKAGRRARDLVRQILTFSRNEQPKRVPMQLAEVVHETVAPGARDPAARRGSQVDRWPSELPMRAGRCHPGRAGPAEPVHQRHPGAWATTKAAVTIELGATTASRLPLKASRIGVPAGRYVTCRVRDTGNGMTPAHHCSASSSPSSPPARWARAPAWAWRWCTASCKPTRAVSMCRARPARAAYSRCISPPQVPRQVAAAARSRAGHTCKAAAGTCMYVDDDQALVFLVHRVLTRKGFEVTTFTDPLEAASRPARANPRFTTCWSPTTTCPATAAWTCCATPRPSVPRFASGMWPPAMSLRKLKERALQAGASALIYKPNDVN